MTTILFMPFVLFFLNTFKLFVFPVLWPSIPKDLYSRKDNGGFDKIHYLGTVHLINHVRAFQLYRGSPFYWWRKLEAP
jgi:hypothetical protein